MAQRNTATVGSVPSEHVPLVSVWQHVGPEQYPAEWFQALVKRELPGGVLFLSREVRDDRRHVMVVTEGQLCLPGGSCLQWGRYCDPSSVDDCLAQSILRVTRDCASFVEVSSFAACFSAMRCNACVIFFFFRLGIYIVIVSWQTSCCMTTLRRSRSKHMVPDSLMSLLGIS
jgi:hypothetical protein